MTERSRILLRLAIVAALGATVVGCESLSNMNPFGEKEKPLPGERRPVPQVAPPPPDVVLDPLSALTAAASTFA
ncbi:hypothetical protein ACFQ4O_09610 [Methylopila musalis]|uniref:Uncharacterized protein n=1 Tax=Methylopila musalis TaxID=1134781 RepID=A0ABW3Z7W2_9HYPH